MAHVYPDTPRTEYADQTALTNADLDMSIDSSFHSPSKHGDDLVRQMRGQRTPRGLTTPSSRNALVGRRNPPAGGKHEFTPLLKSAMKNRISSAFDKENGASNGNGNPIFKAGIETPAALKPGYKFDSPGLPEASSMYDGNSSTDDATEMNEPPPPIASSSIMSTPMAPRGGDGVLDRGNMLTLREQEAVRSFTQQYYGISADHASLMYRNSHKLTRRTSA